MQTPLQYLLSCLGPTQMCYCACMSPGCRNPLSCSSATESISTFREFCQTPDSSRLKKHLLESSSLWTPSIRSGKGAKWLCKSMCSPTVAMLAYFRYACTCLQLYSWLLPCISQAAWQMMGNTCGCRGQAFCEMRGSMPAAAALCIPISITAHPKLPPVVQW